MAIATKALVVATLLEGIDDTTETDSLVLCGMAFKLGLLVVDIEATVCVVVTNVDAFVTDCEVFITGVDDFVIDIDDSVTEVDFVLGIDADCNTRFVLGTNSDIEDTSNDDVKVDILPAVPVMAMVEVGE